jgi:hypothetical protein
MPGTVRSGLLLYPLDFVLSKSLAHAAITHVPQRKGTGIYTNFTNNI